MLRSHSAGRPRLRALPAALCVAPSITASQQSALQASFATGDMTMETGVSLSRSIREAMKNSSETAHSVLVKKASPFRAAVLILRDKLPSLTWFFADLLDLMDTLCSEVEDLSKSLNEKLAALETVSSTVKDTVTRVQLSCQNQMRESFEAMDKRDHEIHAAETLAETLSNRVKELEEQNSKLRWTVHRMSRREGEIDRESAMHRSQLSEMQNKSHAIVQENVYLRQICRHNRDLLLEIEELKDEHSRQLNKLSSEAQRVSTERDLAAKEADGALSALRRMTKTNEAMQCELSALKEALASAEECSQRLHAELDYSIGVVTPRPMRDGVQQVLDSVCAVLGEPRVALSDMTTERLLQHMCRFSSNCAEALRKSRLLTDRQASLIEYISLEDFEVLNVGAATSLTGPCGGAESSTIKPFLCSAPLHSRVLFAHGVEIVLGMYRNVALSLATGLVGCRTMSLEELLLVIDDVRAERRAQPVSIDGDALAAHMRHYAAARNSSNPVAAQEFLMTMDYSLDLHKYSPPVELFKRTLCSALPEALHYDLISRLDQICRDAWSLPSDDLRLVSVGKSQMKVSRRKTLLGIIQKVFPRFSDNTMFRLKAVIHGEMQRLSKVDSKLASALLAKEEVILDYLLGSPLMPDAGSEADCVLLSTTQRQSPPNFRKAGSCIMPPFVAAMFRAAVDEYEQMLTDVIVEVGKKIIALDKHVPVTSTSVPQWDDCLGIVCAAKDEIVSQEVLCDVLTNYGFTAEVSASCADHCCTSHASQSLGGLAKRGSLSHVAFALRNYHLRSFHSLPPQRTNHIVAVNDALATMEPVRTVDLTKKAVNLLRSLQR